MEKFYIKSPAFIQFKDKRSIKSGCIYIICGKIRKKNFINVHNLGKNLRIKAEQKDINF